MKRIKALVVLLAALVLTSCFEDRDDNLVQGSNINDFVWKAMNSWYYWQPQVPDLSDEQVDNSVTYNELINKFESPKDFFTSLRFDIGVTDRFSWFVEDYIALQQSFQGITKSFGLDFEAVQVNSGGDIVIYISHVVDDSPAKDAGIKRGDIVNAIDGTAINTVNYNDLRSKLFGETVTLSFVTDNNGSLEFIEDKTISSRVVSENPVFLRKVFNDIGGKKVGYLVYTGFRSSYNDELNDAFQFFKGEAIDELIIDLRLNGGGSVLTSAYLASMVYSDAGTDTFVELKHNTKRSDRDSSLSFQNTLNVINSNGEKTGEQPINRLTTVSKLHVLVSNNTASASELIINALRPFIPVKLFGTTTIGKNVGSITLYDSPASNYQDKDSANQSHLYALQPIVFQTFNKLGESDYTQGFSPDIEVQEFQFWRNILPFGDENEVLLKAALDDIRGVTTKSYKENKISIHTKPLKKYTPYRFDSEMYIENDFQ